MLLGLCLVGVTRLGRLVVAAAGRPRDPLTRRRLERRMRALRRHPEWVTLSDVETRLRADSVASADLDRTMRRATGRGIGARTLWRWVDRHGSESLLLVVDAGLAGHTLRGHLVAGTVPDPAELAVFATLNNATIPAGIPIDELVDLDRVPVLADLTFPGDLADWTMSAEPGDNDGDRPPVA